MQSIAIADTLALDWSQSHRYEVILSSRPNVFFYSTFQLHAIKVTLRRLHGITFKTTRDANGIACFKFNPFPAGASPRTSKIVWRQTE